MNEEGPTLVKIMKAHNFKYEDFLPIEILTYRYWFKAKILKLLIKDIQ